MGAASSTQRERLDSLLRQNPPSSFSTDEEALRAGYRNEEIAAYRNLLGEAGGSEESEYIDETCFRKIAVRNLGHALQLPFAKPLLFVSPSVSLRKNGTWANRTAILYLNFLCFFEDDSCLKALNADNKGEVRRRSITESLNRELPVVASEVFHICNDEGKAYCFNANESEVAVSCSENGKTLWTCAFRLGKGEDSCDWKSRLESAASLEYMDMFDVGAKLGKGAFSEVRVTSPKIDSLCAACSANENEFAVKVVNKDLCDTQSEVLAREIRILSQLNHPNILRIKMVFETHDFVYIVTELVSGGELFDHIAALSQQEKGYSERDAAKIMTMIFDSLSYIHARGIGHRDLKPENLLFTSAKGIEEEKGVLKLVDFGISKEFGTQLSKTMTGTPFYVAPEIVALSFGDTTEGYGKNVDCWSAGVIMYMLLCGFPPFQSPTGDMNELLALVRAGDFTFPSPYWDNISDESRDLISKLLRKNPAKRISALNALNHPWIKDGGTDTAISEIVSRQLALLSGKKKLKKVVTGIVMMRRLSLGRSRSRSKMVAASATKNEKEGELRDAAAVTAS